ncbi:serine/threonine-protein kinase [Nocardioides sp. LHG3406-4]|uniref:serine/threonine-protein kinase n=1 Tax=Nocardioides sp. LHG3406-4 TaxID=2804575 RepID=UPI003CEC4D4B
MLRTRPPETLVAGRYALLDQIGAGGMGSVWRARDGRTGRLVAAKVLGHHSDALLVRFVREQAVRIRHPHVLAPTGWVAEDDLVVIVMDLVTGGSVQSLISEHGPLPEGYVARVLEQTLRGLAAVHAAGVVHRDVKPANLLLEPTRDGTPHVRLADFGVAAVLTGDRFTSAPGAIGTDGFMAPEQGLGGAPDPRQDLYSVGAVGLYLLTGVHPSRTPQIPSSRLRPLLEWLLAPEPEHRLASADEALRLLQRLAPAYDGGPAAPDRLGPAPDEARVPLGARLQVAAFGAVTVACAVVVVLLLR